MSQIQITHQNPDATMPLIATITIDCNTPDEQIISNIRTNSAGREWLKIAEAHDRTAVICGSGPSLTDYLSHIDKHQKGDVFALNGTASYLLTYGIWPDYQVLLDARPQTSKLIDGANAHLFASQVDPKCFFFIPQAIVWQVDVGNMKEILPSYDEDYALIGGSTSVGLTAICLAYAMGYRKFELYGYDSSHRDAESHAFAQPINDGEPCTVTEFNGRKYLTSYTMKLQAQEFGPIARQFQAGGCTIKVHGSGLLPDMWNAPVEKLSEQEKYNRMWEFPEYRSYAPGEHAVGDFLRVAKPAGGETLIDFGCGTGRASLKLKEAGLSVLLTDFSANCRDTEAVTLPFLQTDLTQPMAYRARYGFCTDVMEHIPPNDVDTVIKNIMSSVGKCFFQISTVPDVAGSFINQKLHLTVEPHSWWRFVFAHLGYVVEHEKDLGNASQFLITKKEQTL